MRHFFLVVAFTLLVSACSHQIPMSPTVDVSRDKVPRDIGLYLSDEFTQEVWSEGRYGDTWNFPLGAASAKAVPQAVEQAFQKMVMVRGLPPYAGTPPAVDAVLAPRIEDFTFDIPLLKTSTYSAEIAYRFTLYDLKGAPVASWRVEGYGARKGELGFEFAKWPGLAANMAIEDAMRRFVEEIEVEPEVSRWLNRETATGGT